MLEIIADVVSTERQHRHRIAADLSDSARRGGGCLGGHGGAEVNAVSPIERLINQWHRITAASAENDGADGNAFAFFNIDVESRIIAHRRGKPAIRMRGLFFRVRRPIVPTPIDSVFRRRAVFSFPPNIAVISEGHVRVKRVVLD